MVTKESLQHRSHSNGSLSPPSVEDFNLQEISNILGLVPEFHRMWALHKNRLMQQVVFETRTMIERRKNAMDIF
jgi:hypothetical protein